MPYIYDEPIAQEILKQCQNKKAILAIKTSDKKEYPPLPYNLLILQAEASKLYGFSPSKTLEITQTLREKYKAISYNRSDCQYLPVSIFAESKDIIAALKSNFHSDIGQNNANLSIKSKAFDDSKLSAHYGIIPTKSIVDTSKLSQDENAIYELICKRFLMQFYEPREYIGYERIKKLLLEKDKDKKGESGGIGTPATRSAHIQTLIDRGYIEVSKDKKQNINATPKGRSLMEVVTPMLATPDMTAFWFEYQKAIERGEVSRADFLKSVFNSVKSEVENIKNSNFSIKATQSYQCPKCQKGKLLRRKGTKGFFWACSEIQTCNFIAKDKNNKPILNTK